MEIFNWQVHLYEYVQMTVFYVPWSSAGIGSVAVCSVLAAEASELEISALSSAFSTSVPLNIKIRKHNFKI